MARDADAFRNPWNRLRWEAFPKWQEAMDPTPPPHSDQLRRVYRGYLAAKEDAARREAACKAILEAWAIECWLVEQTGGPALKPAGWIVEEAQDCCQLWNRPAGGDTPGSLAGSVGTAFSKGLPPPPWLEPFGGLTIPMDNPRRRDDETWPDFKKRARKALTRHLKRMSGGKDPWPAVPKTLQVPKARSPKLDHFEWLVLYQCCAWRLAAIRALYPHVGTDSAIYMGLKEKADLIGLALRPRGAFKKTLTSQLEITPPDEPNFLNDPDPN
jgi:hypothetical protein